MASTSRVALIIALPPTCSVREPIVPMPRGTLRVSEWTTLTSAIGTPSVHDTSCAHVVSWPWPCGEVPVFTVTVPSSATVQVPTSTPRPVSST